MDDTEFTNHEPVNAENTVATFQFEPGDDASQTRIDLELLEEALEKFAGKDRTGNLYLTVVDDGPVVVSTFPDGTGVGVAPRLDEADVPDEILAKRRDGETPASQDTGTDRYAHTCFGCGAEFDSLDEMEWIDGKGHRDGRHFCEDCAEDVLSTTETERGDRDV